MTKQTKGRDPKKHYKKKNTDINRDSFFHTLKLPIKTQIRKP